MKMILAMCPTIFLVVYSQLMTTSRVRHLNASAVGEAPDRTARLFAYMSDPLILSAYGAALAGAVAWMFVVERYSISVAFPTYIGLTVAVVAVAGALFFGENVSATRVVGIGMIIAGVAVASRG